MSSAPSSFLRHTPQPFAPPSDDPFRDDVFERKPQAEKLTELIQGFANQPFVLAINGVWGSGKSMFLNMWDAHLRQNGFHTLRFNAWENDHSEDPFASIFSEFRQLTQTKETEKQNGLTKLYKKAKKMAVPILAKSTASAIKHATMGVLDLSPDAESALGELAEQSAKHLLERAESAKKSIESFREELAKFVKEAATDKPVVYFIDELDRCRPTYAISVLERVKHLLNVSGIVFVFAWDRFQLNETIRNIYGQQTDPSGYLFRFVDLEFNLSVTSHRRYCHALMQRFGLFDYLDQNLNSETSSIIMNTFPEHAKSLHLSIRDQEKVFTILSVAIRTGFQEDASYIEALVVMAALRIKFSEVYKAICKLSIAPGNSSPHQLIDNELPSILGRTFWQSNEGGLFEGHLIYLFFNKQPDLLPGKYAYLQSPQAQHSLPGRESRVQSAYRYSHSFSRKGGLFACIINKIEFSENFLS
ncbi:P-loop NTPase fold protein [Prosthecobacter sp.]|uniref:KAP family P-loop NTPase fold protein n=1 Tax=Prosthecobacter sp. TaxID=1965333 RepID=UPI003782FF94